VDPQFGLAFDLLSSKRETVLTGQENGVITLDLAESDDVHREQLRIAMAEPYRTLLGHFRRGTPSTCRRADEPTSRRAGKNSSAQISWPRLRELFGDPDHRAHRQAGEDNYVSSYATMHPAEDWAETFAHYPRIRDTLDTAAAFGHHVLSPADSTPYRNVATTGLVTEHGEPRWAATTSTRSCFPVPYWTRCASSTPSSTK
jgi:hypothetical protein